MSDRLNKNCFLSFRNKKQASLSAENALTEIFTAYGVYFEKTAFVAYDNAEEIVRAIGDACENYQNTVIFCLPEMQPTVCGFLEKRFNFAAETGGEYAADGGKAFIIKTDCDYRAKAKEICENLNKSRGEKFKTSYVKTVYAPAEKINSAIAEAQAVCGEISFDVSENFGDCRIAYSYPQETPKTVVDGVNRAIIGILNPYIYALEDITLTERLVQLLKLRKMKMSVAESFTGGGICQKLVEISGVSEVFYEGLNTYSNKSKRLRLGVNEYTLSRYGAVSGQTAAEMAAGLMEGGNCDVCVATTGIAGPKSDNTLKPVGLAYIAVGDENGISVYEYNLTGNREQITKTAINIALFNAFKAIR